MGFVEKSTSSFSPADGTVVHELLSSEDWMGAWMLLSGVKDTDPPWALHGKAMCLMEAGRKEEALEAQRVAFRRLTEGVPQKPFDAVGDILINKSGGRAGPGPIHPSMPQRNPTYAGIQARWLLCICLLACGRDEEAQQAAVPLERYGIKPVYNKEMD